jgi:hypothetical protein
MRGNGGVFMLSEEEIREFEEIMEKKNCGVDMFKILAAAIEMTETDKDLIEMTLLERLREIAFYSYTLGKALAAEEKKDAKKPRETKKYRKKPEVVEAYRTDVEFDIPTPVGPLHAGVGDYVITGVKGEQYPCKPDVFELTYELVE